MSERRQFVETRMEVCGLEQRVELLMRSIKNPEDEQRHSKQCDLWAFVWGSSWVLSSMLCSLPAAGAAAVRGARCLEIGAGSGTSSLCAAKLGAVRALMTDLVQDALDLGRANAQRNGVGAAFETRRLNWDAPEWGEDDPPPEFDLLLAADVIYMGRACRPIARLAAAALAPRGAAVIVDPGRPNGDAFEDAAAELLCCARRDVHRLRTPVCCMKKISIFVLTRDPALLEDLWRPWLDRYVDEFLPGKGLILPEDTDPSVFAYVQKI